MVICHSFSLWFFFQNKKNIQNYHILNIISSCHHVILYFGCSKSENLIVSGERRIQSIIAASKARGDNLHVHYNLKSALQADSGLTIHCHKSCVSSYTSKDHISRLLKKRGIQKRSSSEPPSRRRRSSEFDFKQHCFICGSLCRPRDKKNILHGGKLSLNAGQLNNLDRNHSSRLCFTNVMKEQMNLQMR